MVVRSVSFFSCWCVYGGACSLSSGKQAKKNRSSIEQVCNLRLQKECVKTVVRCGGSQKETTKHPLHSHCISAHT